MEWNRESYGMVFGGLSNGIGRVIEWYMEDYGIGRVIEWNSKGDGME